MSRSRRERESEGERGRERRVQDGEDKIERIGGTEKCTVNRECFVGWKEICEKNG